MRYLNLNNKKKIFLVLYISFLIFFSLGAINTFNKFTDIESISSDNDTENDLNTAETFIYSLNGKKYLAEYNTREKVKEMKEQIGVRDPNKNYNQIIDGYGTGFAPPTEKDYENLVGQISILNLLPEPYLQAPAAAHDLSTEIYFPIVGDQGSQGSCAAWAMVYYAYGYLEAKDNGWDAKFGNTDYLMSPAWTYNKIVTSDSGSWMIRNGEILEEWGCATLSTMLYDDTDIDNWGNESAWREAPYHRVSETYLIDFNESNSDSTIEMIKSLINGGTPVTFALDAYQFDDGLTDNYIISSAEYSSSTVNHAQCIVGYNDSVAEDGDVGAFRVVNSWGDYYLMDGGYYWLTYETLKEIGLTMGDWNLHLCYVEDRMDYEPSLIATWEFSSAPTRMDDIITLGVGPHDTPLDMITPLYESDVNNLFPEFMALDISEFQSYYDLNNDVFFYLELGSSNTPGIISSFRIERYISGVLQEITSESPDVPKTTPGYVIGTFMNLDHDLQVDLEVPTNPEITNPYIINATVTNTGIYDETDVDLFLYLDDVLVDSTPVSSLLVGANETINYMWTPTDYKTYNFTAYAPPVPDETYVGNNIATELINIVETKLFDGMFINYTFTIFDTVYPSEFTYSYVSGNIFHVDWLIPTQLQYWDVDAQTRIMQSSSDGYAFGDGYHTPIWIFTDVSLGDEILIAVDTDGDHLFEVSSELIYDLPGFGLVEVWVLEDLNFPGKFAWYEKSTGILLSGTFFYDNFGPLYNYTFEFVDTNVEFTYLTLNHDLSVSLEVPINPEIDQTYIINAIVTNTGSNIETNVDLFLYLNNILINSTTVSTLPVGASDTINYVWTPTKTITYNFTAYAPPVLDESYIDNNIKTKLIILRTTIFFEDFESGLSQWDTITGLWHLTDEGSAWPDPYHSPTHSMWFGSESTGNYDTGLQETGDLISVPIDLSSTTEATLDFYHWREGEGSSNYDVSSVYISIDGINWDLLYDTDADVLPWEKVSIDISKYAGNSSVQLMFSFDTIDSLFNGYRGWLVDDIEIWGKAVYDHDLKVYLEVPTYSEIDNTYTINATVYNNGENYETNVNLFLYLDDVIVNSTTIPSLLVYASVIINYNWTPTQYKTYNFTAYAPPVPGETHIVDNIVTELISIIDTKLFDGMFINYTFTIFGDVKPSDFTYSYVSGNIFHVDWYMDEGGSISHMYWDVVTQTRIMENSGGDGWQFGDGVHTPIWIFTDVSLGDEILIAADAEGDHLFSVADELIYDLPGFGLIEVWELEDLTLPGGIAWYEKSTGILLNGTFYYGGGSFMYTFDFVDTNVEFTYAVPPGDFILSSNAGTPDDNGNFDLTWESANGALNYSVYEYSSYITEINGSLTLLGAGITDLSLALSDYTDGTYYFIVVAHNAYGDTLSNCIEVVVGIPPGDFILSSNAGTPDNDGNFDLTWESADRALNYSVYQFSSYITEINGSLTLLIEGTTDLSLPLSVNTNGIYYFIVVAHNNYGDTLSNCIEVGVGIPPGNFILSSNAGTPDDDGTFDLTWEYADRALNYSVYEFSSYITEINGSLTLLGDGITDLSLALSGYIDGTYYFIAVAHNAYGGTLSNCIEVVVGIPPGDFIVSSNAGTPDDDGNFDLMWGSADRAQNYSVYQYSSYITVIDGSLTLLTDGITDLSLALSGYTDGTYYFIVVAHNANGDTLSNCIEVVVQLPSEPAPPAPGIPGYNLYVVISMICIVSIILFKKRYKLNNN